MAIFLCLAFIILCYLYPPIITALVAIGLFGMFLGAFGFVLNLLTAPFKNHS